ncbi:MAG: DUF2147 domain-containing protein [Cyclobacteriaceae bacterium]|nr:DUF2147 domain-containing protein [Cyclobacteriaceae bacterium]
MRYLLTAVTLCVVFLTYAQTSPVGKWKTIDDETGKEKSIVEIYEHNGKYYGKIIKLFRKPNEEQDPICDECDEDDPRYNQKIIGMKIITDMVKDGDEYEDGEILDPNNGKIYSCKFWREGNTLYLRGYWGFIYRTQEWVKYE